MLSTSRALLVSDLLQFHELKTADWAAVCSEDDLVRVCDVADFLTLQGPSTPSGSSMSLSKACALAAVYIREGAPRDLARSRRDTKAEAPDRDFSQARPSFALQHSRPEGFAVDDDAIEFWAEDKTKARARRDDLARSFAERAGDSLPPGPSREP